jgi:hypothetical protein
MWRLVLCLVAIATLLLPACSGGKRMTLRDHVAAQRHDTTPRDARNLSFASLKNTELRGSVNSADMIPVPVTFATVELSSVKGDFQQTTTTDHEGKFAFVGKIPNGRYRLRVAGEYDGSLLFDVDGHVNDELALVAKRR